MPIIFSVTQAAVSLPRRVKRLLVFSLDLGLSVLSVWLALCLRLGAFVSLSGQAVIVVFTALCLLPPFFIGCGLYRTIFRYNGLLGMASVAQAISLYGLAFAAIFTFWSVDGVPRTVGLIQPILLLLLVVASRATGRLWLGRVSKEQPGKDSLPRALIYGTGESGRQLASAMASSPEIRVIGFIDDDERLQGNNLNGLPIYNVASLATVVRRLKVTDVLLALPEGKQQHRNQIIKNLRQHRLAVRTLPNLGDLATGKINLTDIRILDIDDLLGREAVKPDPFLLEFNLNGKVVMVTGAGGSIGSELCRQILKCKPKRLLMIEMCEFALYQIDQELKSSLFREHASPTQQQIDEYINSVPNLINGEQPPSEIEIIPLLASVCDKFRMQTIMDTWKPHTVYHAAAYKHVPMVEHNLAEGLRNNVWGTRTCAEAALQSGVSNFVLISTDKAVRPTNIMGASKRLAEMILQAFAEINPSARARKGVMADVKTIFSMVRFGNVLGSSGSVVPMFREQVKRGGPVTLTHRDITRYFMTVAEAAQLVIQAGAMGRGGDVFVLDMGEPVKIIELARRIVELSGLTVRDESNPDGDIEFKVTGLRPGEKLYEELLIGNNPEATRHPRIMRAQEPHLDWEYLKIQLDAIDAAIVGNEVLALRSLLQQVVNGYQPSCEMVDWVYRACTDKRSVINAGQD
jgi:FlaA1/EpsC-like NDP-sugar epimerase